MVNGLELGGTGIIGIASRSLLGERLSLIAVGYLSLVSMGNECVKRCR